MTDDAALAQAQQQLTELLNHSQSLMMATLDAAGHPLASYAPYVRGDSGAFYVFLSGLSAHTQSLRAHPELSVMLIEDEAAARQAHARRRVTYRARAHAVERDLPEFEVALNRLQARFGEIMSVLRGLADFVLFRLEPSAGTLVLGFGQAFALGGERLDQLAHIRPKDKDAGQTSGD